MSAKRIIDDHLELANIGTKTHAQIDTHIADPSAHHIKYTGAEAVAAVETADKYVKTTGDTIEPITDIPGLLIKGDNIISQLAFDTNKSGGIGAKNITFDFTRYIDAPYSESTRAAGAPAINFNKSRGSRASPSDTLSGDRLGLFSFNAWSGSGWLVRAQFGAYMETATRGELRFNIVDTSTFYTSCIFRKDHIDIQNHPIKNIKNHASSALSGTKKLIELDINGVPYYFEVYPTKA